VIQEGDILGKIAYLNSVIIFMIMLSSSALSFAQSSVLAPPWLRKGVFAEYEFNSKGVLLNNATTIPFGNGTYRWDCTDLNSTTAELLITLKGNSANGALFLTTNVYVDVLSRSVYTGNGTLMGTTHLWLPANPSPNDPITVWNFPPDKVVVTIINRIEQAQTPQGMQKTFTISNLITGLKTIDGGNMSFLVTSDFDTGVMVDWGSPRGDNEGTLKAIGVSGLLVDGRLLFTNTNIDLDPNNGSNAISLLVFLGFPIIFFLLFAAIYVRRKKTYRHLTKHKITETRFSEEASIMFPKYSCFING